MYPPVFPLFVSRPLVAIVIITVAKEEVRGSSVMSDRFAEEGRDQSGQIFSLPCLKL